jgi:hypothetical protein
VFTIFSWRVSGLLPKKVGKCGGVREVQALGNRGNGEVRVAQIVLGQIYSGNIIERLITGLVLFQSVLQGAREASLSVAKRFVSGVSNSALYTLED